MPLFWTSWRSSSNDHPTAYLSGQGWDDYNLCQLVRADSQADATAWIGRQCGFLEVRFCNPRDKVESSDRFQRMKFVRIAATGVIHSLPRRLRNHQRK
jgi:hypothetical protein